MCVIIEDALKDSAKEYSFCPTGPSSSTTMITTAVIGSYLQGIREPIFRDAGPLPSK